MTQEKLIEALEPLVDATDLSSVTLALARVADEKAEHIRINWQDNLTARRWDQAARALNTSTRNMAV